MGASPKATRSRCEELQDAMTIVRLERALDALIPPGAEVEKIAGGFTFTEGPLWRPQGVLWFSDVVGNVTRQWSPDGKVIELLRPGGYDGNSLPAGGFIGPNGATAGERGTVVMCQHGNRRIVRITNDLKVTTVIDAFEGKKFNSPNDVVYRSDGSLYFTDPPYGLPQGDSDPSKELPFNGVFKLTGGKLQVVVKDMTRPNGLAFSPDEKTLYVANSDENHRLWMRFDVNEDGTVKNGRVFADVSAEPEAGLPDGMKIDSLGNIWATGPGGVWVFTPAGKHLGTIKLPEQPANCAWGEDGTALFITAETGLYRLRVTVVGQTLVYQ
jgi:gluconolactonase